MPERTYTRQQMDAIARQRGFPDFHTWAAWDRKYRQRLPAEEPAPQNPVPQMNNVLQQTSNQIGWHPQYIFSRIADAIRRATQ